MKKNKLIISVVLVIIISVIIFNAFNNKSYNKEISTIDNTDFVIEIYDESITIYSKYSENKVSSVDNKTTFVGEIKVNEKYYKVNQHEYEDVTIYTSNVNYDIDGRDYNDYVILGIEFINNQLKTSRNISVGSSVDDVISAYGVNYESYEKRGSEYLSFKHDKQELVFEVKQSIVTKININYITD